MFNMMTTVNTAIWYAGKMLRVNSRSTYHKEKNIFSFFIFKILFI